MRKILGLFLLSVMIFSAMGSAIATDDVRVETPISPEHGYAYISEDGNDVEYNMYCVEEEAKYITPDRYTKDTITVQRGVVNYTINNWRDNFTQDEKHAFQLGIWNITNSYGREPNADDLEVFPDKFTINKTLGTPSSVTTVTNTTLANGTIVTKTVTTWTSNVMEFVFRMAGNGILNDNNQDIIMFRTSTFEDTWDDIVETFFNPPTEPVTPTPEENEETPVDNDNPDDDTPVVDDEDEETPDGNNPQDDAPVENSTDETEDLNTTTPESPANDTEDTDVPAAEDTVNTVAPSAGTNAPKDLATASAGSAMKNTGAPLVAILLVLIASMGGIVFRRK